MNFRDYFTKGLHNTVRLSNQTQFSYKNHWKPVYTNTLLDEWFVGDFVSAEYTITASLDQTSKEILKVVVIASPELAKAQVVGRSDLGTPLITITAEVDSARVRIIANPVSPATAGSKVIFSANYYCNLDT